MRTIAAWRRFSHLEAPTATVGLNQPATSLLSGASIPLRWSLAVGPALAAAIGCSAAALADEPEPSAAAPRSEVSCQDQFMIDRRDQPQQALRNFRHCDAVRDLVGKMEYFTFWYVTLPPALRHKQDGMFQKAWNNNLGLLTGRIVSLRKEQAIEVLDDSILRGLKRGKREDLVEKWLASHDPALLGLDPQGLVPAQAVPASTPEPAVAAPSVTRTAVSMPLPQAAKPAPPRSAEISRGQTRHPKPRPALRYRDADEYAVDSSAQILNRTQLEAGWYATGPVAPVQYPTQPYYAVAPPPAAYPAPPRRADTYSAPFGAAPVPAPAQAAASAPSVTADLQQSRSLPPSMTYTRLYRCRNSSR